MITKEVDNEQISDLLYTYDVLVDIIIEYKATIPYTTRLHPDKIAEYARSTGKEMFKHITPAHFTKNKRISDYIDDVNQKKWMQETSNKWEALELLVVDIMEDYVEENPSVTEIECRELYRYAKWSEKEEYKKLEYADFNNEYILDRIEEFNRVLSGYYDK